MKSTLLALLLLSPLCSFATEQTNCSANKGTFLTGPVTTSPKFQAASQTLSDYVKNSTSMPASLAALKAGTRLEVCGEKYSDGSGIHWVHNNCGDTPSTSAPNGWTKTIATSGSVSANLERSTNYCYLWN